MGGSLDACGFAAGAEAVLQFSLHSSQMSHATGARRPSADGLLGPVVASALGARAETGVGIGGIVPVALAADSADRVPLRVAFTLGLTSCTLREQSQTSSLTYHT